MLKKKTAQNFFGVQSIKAGIQAAAWFFLTVANKLTNINNFVTMAEKPNPKKIRFEAEKKILDEVADEVACSICKIFPRDFPLYASPEGNIVCFTCKNASPEKNYQQNDLTRAMEKMLSNLPKACKFRNNGCKIAANLNSIEYHEEDCEFRKILCFYRRCTDIYPFRSLSDHMKSKHNVDNVDLINYSIQVEQNGSKFTMIFKPFPRFNALEFQQVGWGCKYIGVVREKQFMLNFQTDPGFETSRLSWGRYIFFWVQMIGSKFESKNFKYSLQVEDPEYEGTHIYKGYVKSLDDKKTDVYRSSTAGLIISLEVLEKFPGNELTMEIEIEDQKRKEDSNIDEEFKNEK